jgi:PST family polysaccharide transporter
VGGAGPYSLAWGHVVGEIATGALIMAWGKVPVRFGFDRVVSRRLLAFGLPLAGALAVEAVLMNADYVIVGNLLGEESLGFYLMAFNISSWIPSIVGTAVSYVSLAGFSRLSEKDTAALQTGVERSVPALLTILIPVAVLIGVLAAPMLAVLYGSRWVPSAAVLSVLMGLTVVRMLTDFALDILSSAGATRPSLWVNLAWAATLVPALLLGTRWGGAVGAAVAHVIIGALVALPLTGYALHRVGVRLRPVGRAVRRPALAGLLTLAVCLSLAQFPAPALARLVIVGLVGVAVFGATGIAPQDRQRLVRRLAPLATRLVAKLRPAR